MCGRYFVEGDNERMLAILDELNRRALPMTEFLHTGAIFPSEIAPVILREPERGVTVRPMKWGFPRSGGGGLVINSRSEKADITPMFQRAVRERRCLIPASGFWEWRRTPSGGKTKDQFAFSLSAPHSQELMYLAGVYGQFVGGFENGGFDGFAILTREADEQMAPYHNRMPVILRDESLKKAWLNCDVPFAGLRAAFQPPELRVTAVPRDTKGGAPS